MKSVFDSLLKLTYKKYQNSKLLGLLWGETTADWWILLTKDKELDQFDTH